MTEWVLTSRKKNLPIRHHSYWTNWINCNDDEDQDLKKWNAEMVFVLNGPTELHFETQEDMVIFLLRWS